MRNYTYGYAKIVTHMWNSRICININKYAELYLLYVLLYVKVTGHTDDERCH
jgi:hypothetical protein